MTLFGLSPPELGLLGMVIAALIGGIFRYSGAVKAAIITAESGTNSTRHAEVSDNNPSAGERASGDQVTSIAAGRDVLYGQPADSNTPRSPENETNNSVAKENYPHATYCSPIWADTSMTKWEHHPETDETVVKGEVKNSVNARYKAQVTIGYSEPNTDRGGTIVRSTTVALDPGETKNWKILIDCQAEEVELYDPWVRECTSVEPPWDALPIDYTDYPECAGYTTTAMVEQQTAVRDRTHVTIRISNLFGREINARFWLDYTLNGVSQSTDPKTKLIGPGDEVISREVIDAPKESIANVWVGTPDADKDCRLIYGEP